MDEVKEITEIIEAYSDASCTERSGEGKEDYEETIRRSIAKAFGEPRVGDCAALAYLSVARTAWRASEENAGCAQTMAEGLSDGLFHTRCSVNVRGLAADTLAEVVSVSARAKEAVFTRCITALSTASADQPQQQQQQQQEEVSLVGTAEVLGQLFTGRAAVEAVVGALCAPGVSQQARRMLVRVALVPLVERGTEADNTDDCLELVWDSVLKTRDTQTILMTVAQLSKAFMHRGSKDFMHRKELWDTIYSALCNSTDDLYAKNCAVFVIGRYAECCGNACEKELWESFVIVWEALETHATELIKPAWKRLESLVRPGRERYLEPRWPTLLFDRALNHFHVPIRRVILVSFLSHGAYSAGVLATDPAFLESVAFRIFCDQVLYKGELRPFSAKLINGFLDSFLSLPIPAAAVVTAYLNALSSAPLFGSSLLIRIK